MTDVRLTLSSQLTRAANGDAPLCSGLDCIYQTITLEALTQKGDLFYDSDFGWSLYDFIQCEDNELTRLELTQRARLGLQKWEAILPETINVNVEFVDDSVRLRCTFRFSGETDTRELNVIIGAVNVEVNND